MRVLALALGAVAAVGFTAAVAAGQAADHTQLAQAQNTGPQPGAGTGNSARQLRKPFGRRCRNTQFRGRQPGYGANRHRGRDPDDRSRALRGCPCVGTWWGSQNGRRALRWNR